MVETNELQFSEELIGTYGRGKILFVVMCSFHAFLLFYLIINRENAIFDFESGAARNYWAAALMFTISFPTYWLQSRQTITITNDSIIVKKSLSKEVVKLEDIKWANYDGGPLTVKTAKDRFIIEPFGTRKEARLFEELKAIGIKCHNH
ncbi:MAG: hypothetical protein HRU19_12160 [Pseudobacteriovorax sp.]|nr:hypothetical protein [Pseudobacteriovorax sp.]